MQFVAIQLHTIYAWHQLPAHTIQYPNLSLPHFFLHQIISNGNNICIRSFMRIK